jgi:DNA-binding NarL/FixJ family response regulator
MDLGGYVLETNVYDSCPNSRVPTKTKIRIAIADDHPIFRDGLCRLLSLEEDFDVVAQMENGLYVSELLQQYDPDILLLDLNMPGLSGLDTLQRLRAANSRTRVILLTASDNQQEFVQALKLGSCGIVQKQTATELLIDSVRRVHAGEMWLDSDTTAAVIRGFVANEEASPPPQKPSVAVPRSPLSQREGEIVNLVAQGFKNREMAEKMLISEQTVKNHLHNIFDKLDVSDRLELALHFIAHGLKGGLPHQPTTDFRGVGIVNQDRDIGRD